jgi:heme O synthase-like polyprenyltransferase
MYWCSHYSIHQFPMIPFASHNAISASVASLLGTQTKLKSLYIYIYIYINSVYYLMFYCVYNMFWLYTAIVRYKCCGDCFTAHVTFG